MDSAIAKKVSVIVPIYNVEQYLPTCIESIIGQSYGNIEIILVDDGSPDNCPQMCDEYAKKDARIKVIHKENGGLSDARNSGLDIATGEFVFFVDSDDYINKYCLELLVKELVRTNADILECHSNNFLDGKNPSWDNKCRIRRRKIFIPDEWLTETRLGKFISCAVWNKLYKSELYRDVRFPIGRIFEDEATTYKVVNKASKICRINSKLYFYRERQGSTITGKMTLKKLQHRILAFQEKADYFSANGNEKVEKFSRAKLCLAAISMIKIADELDGSGKTKQELLRLVKENYQIIKCTRSVPLKYRVYILYYLMREHTDL